MVPNGKCGNCKYQMKRIDKDDDNFVFYAVAGVREHRQGKFFLMKCPNCKQYNVT